MSEPGHGPTDEEAHLAAVLALLALARSPRPGGVRGSTPLQRWRAQRAAALARDAPGPNPRRPIHRA